MPVSEYHQIIIIAIMVIAFVPAIVIHECAHGFAAYKMGDPTAKKMGRLTLNPIKHADPFGTVILPLLLIAGSALSGGGGMVFGYAKPVPYNPRNFKNYKKGELVTAFAGPVSNLVMAVIGAAIVRIVDVAFPAAAAATGSVAVMTVLLYVWYFGMYFCMTNLCLAFFNVIPIPPLDGSSILVPLLKGNALRIYYQIQRYALFALLVIIVLLPRIIGIDIIGWYLDLTAGNIAALLLG